MRFTKFIAASLLTFSAIVSYSQDAHQKVGFADWNYIFGAMPEFKQIETQIKAHGIYIIAQIDAKTLEMQEKLKAFQALPANTDELIKADKQAELQRLDEAIRQFQEDAQRSYEAKRQQLMDPVFTKVGKAIEDVAKENGYS